MVVPWSCYLQSPNVSILAPKACDECGLAQCPRHSGVSKAEGGKPAEGRRSPPEAGPPGRHRQGRLFWGISGFSGPTRTNEWTLTVDVWERDVKARRAFGACRATVMRQAKPLYFPASEAAATEKSRKAARRSLRVALQCHPPAGPNPPIPGPLAELESARFFGGPVGPSYSALDKEILQRALCPFDLAREHRLLANVHEDEKIGVGEGQHRPVQPAERVVGLRKQNLHRSAQVKRWIGRKRCWRKRPLTGRLLDVTACPVSSGRRCVDHGRA